MDYNTIKMFKCEQCDKYYKHVKWKAKHNLAGFLCHDCWQIYYKRKKDR